MCAMRSLLACTALRLACLPACLPLLWCSLVTVFIIIRRRRERLLSCFAFGAATAPLSLSVLCFDLCLPLMRCLAMRCGV